MSNFTSFKFKGDIFIPTDADYVQVISHWALNAQANAKIVTFVKTPKDVAHAIAYARENRLPIISKIRGPLNLLNLLITELRRLRRLSSYFSLKLII